MYCYLQCGSESVLNKWSSAMSPERLAAIDRILVAQILSNLQSFTKVPKSGTPSLYQLLRHPVFSPLRLKCWSFYLKNQNLELAMPHLRSSLFFL